MKKVLEYNITGHDTDYYRCIAPSTYLKIAETSFFTAAEESGILMQRMIDELNATWMTASSHIEIFKDVFYVGPVEVYADPYIVNGIVFTQILHVMRKGTEIARCVMNSMVVNYTTRKIISPVVVADHFGVPYVMGQGTPARLAMPNDMEKLEDYKIRYSDCDHNQHLRALEYVNFTCDAAEYWSGPVREKKGRVLRMEFVAESKAGDTLSLYRKFAPEGVYVSGVRGDGKTAFKAYFLME